jgi:hypothetical protein
VQPADKQLAFFDGNTVAGWDGDTQKDGACTTARSSAAR